MVMMTWLADVLRKAGLTVEEEKGWQTRGRGEMRGVKGILVHHTGGALTGDRPSIGTVLNGRKDLAGPLSQLFLTRSGTWVVLAAGRCNHAGAGSWQGVTDGNGYFIGVEAENAGTIADPWPQQQMDAYQRGCAAILAHLGVDSVWVAGHREYALPRGRKIDPLFDMMDFRDGVEGIMTGHKPVLAPAPIPAARLMLRKGDQGDSVRQLQTELFAWFTLKHPDQPIVLTIDGAFGKGTENAVKAFQRENGLLEDGIAGPKVWAALTAS